MRLIDADKLRVYYGMHISANYGSVRAVVFKRDIDNAPTVDALPVVRCKQCKWWGEEGKPDGRRVCYLLGIRLEPEFWCAYGERKEE